MSHACSSEPLAVEPIHWRYILELCEQSFANDECKRVLMGCGSRFINLACLATRFIKVNINLLSAGHFHQLNLRLLLLQSDISRFLERLVRETLRLAGR